MRKFVRGSKVANTINHLREMKVHICSCKKSILTRFVEFIEDLENFRKLKFFSWFFSKDHSHIKMKKTTDNAICFTLIFKGQKYEDKNRSQMSMIFFFVFKNIPIFQVLECNMQQQQLACFSSCVCCTLWSFLPHFYEERMREIHAQNEIFDKTKKQHSHQTKGVSSEFHVWFFFNVLVPLRCQLLFDVFSFLKFGFGREISSS